MAKLATIHLGPRKFDVYVATGEVLDSRKWATTEVYGGGGSGSIRTTNGQVYGSSYTAPVQSATTTHDQIFVREANGKEHSAQMSDAGLQVRTGSWVSLISARHAGKKSGWYVAVLNHDTGRVAFSNGSVGYLCATMGYKSARGLSRFLGAMGLPVIGAGIFLGPVVLAAGAVCILTVPACNFWGKRRRRAFRNRISSACKQIDGHRPEIPAITAA